MEMMKNSPKDCYDTVQKTTMVILERLQNVILMEGHIQSTSDRVQFNDLQSLLCATLQSVLRKVTPEDAPKISDAIMSALLAMLNGSSGKAGGVQEDALLAVSTLIEVLGENFLKYMDSFKPYLAMGLKNQEEYQVCQAAVGVTGDICRALSGKVLPFSDEIMMMLLENLSNEQLHRSVKPQILSVFGDVALAVGVEFKKYLDVVVATLHQASQAQVDRNDYDMVDYLNELRESCLEAYTGIVQGLKGDGDNPSPEVNVIQPHVAHMLQFVEHIAVEDDQSDGVIAASCGLIGDLCTAFGVNILQMLDKESITNMLTKGRRSKTAKTKALATWATREIRKLKNTSS